MRFLIAAVFLLVALATASAQLGFLRRAHNRIVNKVSGTDDSELAEGYLGTILMKIIEGMKGVKVLPNTFRALANFVNMYEEDMLNLNYNRTDIDYSKMTAEQAEEVKQAKSKILETCPPNRDLMLDFAERIKEADAVWEVPSYRTPEMAEKSSAIRNALKTMIMNGVPVKTLLPHVIKALRIIPRAFISDVMAFPANMSKHVISQFMP